MTDITQYNFLGNDIRIVLKDGETWFVLADVAKVIGLSNPSMIAQTLREKQKSKFGLGYGKDAVIISESGLYRILLRSDKAEVETFQIWVEDEVLPAIRKNGMYAREPETGLVKSTAPAFLASLQNLQQQNEQVLQGLIQVHQIATVADQKADLALSKVTALETEREQINLQLTSIEQPTVDAPVETTRMRINKLVQNIARLSGRSHQTIWHDIYADCRLRFHLDLPTRAKNSTAKSTLEYAEVNGYIEQLYSIAYSFSIKVRMN